MSRERKISLERNTAETKISLSIDLDGTGKYQVDTGCGFLNHMLELFARHGRFDLTLKCDGDTQVDYHHTTEDVGIAMGQAILEALGDKKGIRRYGSFLLPMDETLVMTALDLSGRSYLVMDVEIPTEKVGDFDTELVNLVNQIEDIKAIIQELRQIKAFVDSSVSTFEESAQALKAAVKTSNNISNAICRIFMQVENTVITVKLSEEDKSILAEYRHKLIEEEKTLFEKQITELKTLHANHWKEIQKYVKSHTSFSLNG